MIPSHQLAQNILNFIRKCVSAVGIHEYSNTLDELLYTALILAVALFVGYLLRKLILWSLRRAVRARNSEFGRQLLQARVMGSCCHVIPPLVLLACLPITFETGTTTHTWIFRGSVIYLIITLGIGLNSILRFMWIRYDSQHNARHLPLKGIYDVGVGLVWILVLIFCVSVLIAKSPAVLLGGLGAMATVLMLVFRDSILGFVAGFQMSANDMLHVGDWITVPNTPADGIVVDVTISVVKVQNFDNTMIMLPPYTLVSTSFKNWRGMSDSGIRLISRSVLIDASTIHADSADPSITNLTKFRAHILNYLNNHPRLDHSGRGNSLIMVRLLDPEPAGIPMQLYCFTNTTVWPDYEEIRSELTEYAVAAAPQFGLRVYNYPEHLDDAPAASK